MKKITLLLLFLLMPFFVYGLELPDTYSEVVLIYDLTDQKVLLEKNSDTKRSIASLTKIATIITAIDNIDDLEQKVTITSEMLSGIPSDASIADLKIGDTVTVMDLLYAAMLPSGADATQCLSYIASGSIPAFVDEMNKLAASLGAKDTHFVNVTGYTADNHYSTAEDVLKILNYALKNDIFQKIYKTKEYTMSNGMQLESTLKLFQKPNNLDISRILGSKTGYTSDAGQCISVLVNSNEHDIIIITLKAPFWYGAYNHLLDVFKLIDFLDDNYDYQELIEKDKVIKKIPVLYSDEKVYKIKTTDNITKYLPNDYDKDLVKVEYKGIEELTFLDKEGKNIGQINYYYDNKLIESEDVILTSDFKINIKDLILSNKYIIVITVTLFILLVIITKRKKKKKRKR